MAPEYDLLVRVGGPNAGHKVFGDPVQVYYHLPSGSERAPNARLLLGAGAVLRVPTLLQEIVTRGIELDRLSIDPKAMIIEDEDIAREAALAREIFSTQQASGLQAPTRSWDALEGQYGWPETSPSFGLT